MLDPDVKQLLDMIKLNGAPPAHTLSPADARAFYREGRRFTQPDAPQVASIEDVSAPGPNGSVPIRCYRPLGASATAALPALVFCHGGGHTIGDLDTHDTLCRELCNLAGYAVFAVDYRLGPEHKFPVAVDDGYAALCWVADHAQQLHIDPAQIAVGGDNAGANLAAVFALMARDQDGPSLAYQLLIYPATDFRFESASHKENGEGYMLTTDLINYFCSCYLRSDADRLDWRLSPALASDHRGLPPALIITAGYDPLRDEGKAYAEQLAAAGNAVDYICYPGQIHGFVTMGRVIAGAREAIALCAERLSKNARRDRPQSTAAELPTAQASSAA
ncbi:alpha/beta hydrolase [soil metagenome]